MNGTKLITRIWAVVEVAREWWVAKPPLKPRTITIVASTAQRSGGEKRNLLHLTSYEVKHLYTTKKVVLATSPQRWPDIVVILFVSWALPLSMMVGHGKSPMYQK